MTYFNLETFRASSVQADDIGKRLGIDFGDETPTEGIIYAGTCYIEKTADKYFLVVGRDSYIDTDLGKLERILWASHYICEFGEPVMLRKDDGTLDDFILGMCEAFEADCDGDVFGVLFSGAETFELRHAIETVHKGLNIGRGKRTPMPTSCAELDCADRLGIKAPAP